MDITIYPGMLSGTIRAIPSKSQAHRLLICAAFADGITELICPETNQDIEATTNCLRALGADIDRTDAGYRVVPIRSLPKKAELNCCESGSTLRFMLPVVGALGVNAVFRMAGRLPQRPLSPLWEEMERMGCSLERPTPDTISCHGRLKPGTYTISGSVSSQFITGLLFAVSLLEGTSKICVTGKLESKPYVDMTQLALRQFSIETNDFSVSGSLPFHTPGQIEVEGDWSNGAFFLAAKEMGCKLDIRGLKSESAQGDRAAAQILASMTDYVTVDTADIPDLVPILAVAAGTKKGAKFINIERLRLKESDRVASVLNMLKAFGVKAEADANSLTVYPAQYHSCTIDAVGDHRIAMAAAIGACCASGPVTILGAHCVSKSYPSFWEEYKRLGGNYEQHIR